MDNRVFFVTATDTGVGKTMTVYALALLLREEGFSVGILKPVQSGGDDAGFLRRKLGLKDSLRELNPFCALEPVSPHLALRRAKMSFDPNRVISALDVLLGRYDIVLVEGAGGLLVPLAENFLMADLAARLDCPLIVVARPGLGTINHTLLTLSEARNRGLEVAGVVLCHSVSGKKGLAEKNNPKDIMKFGTVPLLGELPYIRKKDPLSVLAACRKAFDLRPLFVRQNVTAARWEKLDKKFVWHPFTQMQDWLSGTPLVITRARGSYLEDASGNRYIDGVSSLWVTVHGHGHPVMTQAVARQAARLDHSTMLGLANAPAAELAQKLVGLAPEGLSKVFYSDNGSTAVEVAVKMSYQYWQNAGQKKKTRICHLANSYHGDTLGSVSIGGIDLFHKVYRGLTFPTHQVDFPDCYRGKYPQDALRAVTVFESFLKKNHASTAALILEPIVQGAAGMIMWPAGILKRFEVLCRKYDVLLICDEVATGFGRTGTMFACQQEDVHPDLMCVAKGLTGGVLPLAATLTTQKIFDGFVRPYEDMKTFFHGHTFTGNPIACAAALASLDLFRKERTLEKLRPKIGFLARRLDRLRRNEPFVGDIRQRGFMVGIELVEDRATRKPFAWQKRVGVRVCEQARRYGAILRPLGNVIVLMPPLSISEAELDHLVSALERALEDVRGDMTRPWCGC